MRVADRIKVSLLANQPVRCFWHPNTTSHVEIQVRPPWTPARNAEIHLWHAILNSVFELQRKQ